MCVYTHTQTHTQNLSENFVEPQNIKAENKMKSNVTKEYNAPKFGNIYKSQTSNETEQIENKIIK